MNEQPPMVSVERSSNLRMSLETTESNIQVPHEPPASSLLIRLVEIVSALDVGIGRE